jgi:RNA polymerase sigma factor (sigma-70 family)
MQSESEFMELVKQNQGIIKKLVGLYANSEEDKKDMYQEILYQAWKGFPGFKGNSKFSTWLYRVSLNTILTANRKANLTDYQDTVDEKAAVENHALLASEDARLLRQSIRRLPDTDRAIITLHLDGYANPEIAEIMGISFNHVAVKLHRIKQVLVNLLQPR